MSKRTTHKHTSIQTKPSNSFNKEEKNDGLCCIPGGKQIQVLVDDGA